MISIHDDRLVEINISAERREVLLNTIAETGGQRKQIRFSGVVGYHFQDDNLKTILFDIVRVDATEVIRKNEEKFQDGIRIAWPGIWNVSSEAALEYLQAEQVHGFLIQPSFGMEGWILAKDMEVTDGTAS